MVTINGRNLIQIVSVLLEEIVNVYIGAPGKGVKISVHIYRTKTYELLGTEYG
jgi:hypothetical protein